MKEIISAQELESVFSADGPLLLFKHSTRCSVSAAAFERFRAYLESQGAAAPEAYLVRVIESRPVSNALADRTGVAHASPQLLILGGGKALWSASHNGITAQAIAQALTALSEA